MLGKVLYSALSGDSKKFPREDFATPQNDLRVRLQRPELTPFNNLLAQMIVADPAGRFQTMDDVIQAIDHTWLQLSRPPTSP